MLYISTRGHSEPITSAEAILKGIAGDGGLFIPEKTMPFSMDVIKSLALMDYKSRAKYILGYFLDDFSAAEIEDSVDKAYDASRFDSPEIAPLVKLNSHMHIMELWHGPTCAFKDMALQLMPHLLVKAASKSGSRDKFVILVATSGDTGKAALEGFRDVAGTEVIVFYPKDGVSEIQKLQMVTQEGSNVHTIAVTGNFDDAQRGVKAVFADAHLAGMLAAGGMKFSSANSINWGRLVPQIVYYISAYAQLIADNEIKAGEKINFAVPTGNFGNILAGYYAMRMGIPVNKLICASNINNVLTQFINTGRYDRKRRFYSTMSPSMDILISSNLERLLFEVTGHDAKRVAGWMADLSSEGVYSVDAASAKIITSLLWAGYSSEEDTLKTIQSVYKDYGYVVDTHTAVGIDVYDKYVISTSDLTRTIVASTANPLKFNGSIARALFGPERVKGKSEFELLTMVSAERGLKIPPGLRDLDKKPVLHKAVCGKDDMAACIAEILTRT